MGCNEFREGKASLTKNAKLAKLSKLPKIRRQTQETRHCPFEADCTLLAPIIVEAEEVGKETQNNANADKDIHIYSLNFIAQTKLAKLFDISELYANKLIVTTDKKRQPVWTTA